MSTPIYIIGINASPRKNSNTEILMHRIMESAKSQNAVTELVHLKDLNIKPCLACEGCRVARVCRAHADDMQVLISKLKAAQGIVLGSPVHNYNISSFMKIFLDRMYPLHYFNPENRLEHYSLLEQNKKTVIYTIGEQKSCKYSDMALNAMRLPMKTLGCDIIQEFAASGFFKTGSVLKDEKLLQTAYKAGVDLVQSLKDNNNE